MSSKQKTSLYMLELSGLLISALGMMTLLVIGVWAATLVAVGSNNIYDGQIGDIEAYDSSNERFAFWQRQSVDAGQVAGVVDDASAEETALRNEIADWLSAVRRAQGLPVVYRDSVLDRNAQNQARFLSDKCATVEYSDWSDSLGMKVDEGFTTGFSEAIFAITKGAYASNMVDRQTDYSRLFTNADAFGVGIAEFPEQADCGDGFKLVIHLAEVR